MNVLLPAPVSPITRMAIALQAIVRSCKSTCNHCKLTDKSECCNCDWKSAGVGALMLAHRSFPA